MAKQYEIVERKGATLLYVEKTEGGKEAAAKKLKLDGFLFKGLRKGLTIIFRGLPQARNLRVLLANGTEKPLVADVPVDTIPAKGKAGRKAEPKSVAGKARAKGKLTTA
ncbi:hypothetical protein MLDJOKPK_00045 [Salmonella phage SPAsTU]|nr:hypothetical protein STsAS_093 [Salmonella phage STsAS]AWN08997.1 hypothetical protein MLDJOKPK_00045 [Salmonella phage SPAsTU]